MYKRQLGYQASDILAQVRETRELVLMSLVRPARLSALAQHEWDAHDGVHAPPTAAVGVGRLLRRLDEALGVRSLDAAAPLVEAKMAHEIHRYWVAVLCGFSADGVGEEAAVAAELLYALRAWATASAGKPPRDTDGGRAFAAHASAVRHMLDLWERGREVPGL